MQDKNITVFLATQDSSERSRYMQPSAIRLIAGKEPIRKAVLLQIQYDRGELYYDRSGQLFRQWEKLYSGWDRAVAVNGPAVRVINFTHEWTCEFGPTTATFTHQAEASPFHVQGDQVQEFAHGTERMVRELVDEFDLEEFSQISYKEAYHFPCDSIEDSSAWIRRIGIAPVPEAVLKVFGPEYYAQTSTIVMFSPECRYRIEVKGVENHAMVGIGNQEVSFRPSVVKRLNRSELLNKLKQDRVRKLNPEYYGCVDLEAFLWDSVAPDFEIADFVVRQSVELLEKFRACVEVTEQKDA
jgi:hypothetical protein